MPRVEPAERTQGDGDTATATLEVLTFAAHHVLALAHAVLSALSALSALSTLRLSVASPRAVPRPHGYAAPRPAGRASDTHEHDDIDPKTGRHLRLCNFASCAWLRGYFVSLFKNSGDINDEP